MQAEPASQDSTEESDDEEILEVARKRFQIAVDAEAEIRREALDDLKFRAGDQWPEDVKQSRNIDKRPCLTINKLPQFLRQVTNDQRQNRPSIKVNPVDDKADKDTAKIFEGLIRHIEYNSNADVAYDTAFEGAATKGFGYLRVITDFVDPNSFNQEILIKRVRNAFTVYLDPNYHEPDGSDANWGFIFETVNKDDFKAEYPKATLSEMADWESVGDRTTGWTSKDTCRVSEYFYKTFKRVTICLLSNAQTVDKSTLPNPLPEGLKIVKERETVLPAIQWCKINGVEILEKTQWLGQWIPIIPVLGDELDVDGKKILEGIVRHAKDPQRMYNYWASSETETIALAPKAPFIIAEGQIEGYEDQWKTANTKNHAVLPYKPKTIGGIPVPPPTRNVFEPPVQAITQARAQSSDDLKSTTGIYDASLGNRSNENSGVAIQRRNAQAQTTNFHYIDNLSRSLRHVGRILVDLIPKIYDTPTAARIIGDDGSVNMVLLNQIFQENGQQKIHQLSSGKYDVTISTGPNFTTRRQEAASSMLDFMKIYPQGAQVVGDLMVRNMDWPGADKIADRLKRGLPPGIAEDDKDQPPIPPQVQAQIQQMSQMIDGLTKHLQSANDKIQTKTIELESKERIETMKMQVAMVIEQARLQSQDGRLAFQQELAHLNTRMDLLNSGKSIENEMAAGAEGTAQPTQQQPPTGGSSPGQPPQGGPQ